ncbi:GNAT family N-acetyltransferase [uncultured Megasphaera sp.]|uniref:GNAT family N-acetyltransferase n=1 Tax=uncultured Megasphaera sp. TaxID=165188 RepID=UPI0026583A93|nr:GNAT family N-acetyltransferase [uncultured Megasphaera sp.]
MLTIRPYRPSDCPVLIDLFYHTVHTINIRDYSHEQCCVWATGTEDAVVWNRSFLAHYTIVAEIGNIIAGFGDIDKTGYVDRLFTHADYQCQGIASAICNTLESAVSVNTIITYASITARRFFEKRGYIVIKKQKQYRQAVCLTNYLMEYKR